jgi:transcriptional regulator with XRE-family HTH domain
VISETVLANIRKLIDQLDEGVPTRAARRLKINQKTLDRYYKSERIPTLDFVEQLAKGYGFQAWQLLIPDFDPSNPPLLSAITKEEKELYARLKSTFAELQAIKPSR